MKKCVAQNVILSLEQDKNLTVNTQSNILII